MNLNLTWSPRPRLDAVRPFTTVLFRAGEIRSLHGAGLSGLLRFRKTYGKKDDKHSDALMELLEGLLRSECGRLTAQEALASPWLTQPSDSSATKKLPNPAVAALALRALERSAKTCVALLEDEPRTKLREALTRAPTPGLPANCALLGDIVRALDAKDDSAAAATLRALHPDPDLVLVHRPLALEATYVRQRAEQKAALDRRRSMPQRARSEPRPLARKNLSNPDLRALARESSAFTEVGRRDAPGATADAVNMDGTFYSAEALLMDASAASKVSAEGLEDSLHGLQTPVSRVSSQGFITPVGSEASLADVACDDAAHPHGGRGGVRSLGDMPGKEA